MTDTLVVELPSLWSALVDVRAKVAQFLQSTPEDVCDAAVMAASELVENAIKYGTSGKGDNTLQVKLEGADLRVQVCSKSGAISRIDELKKTIDEIRVAPDIHELYLEHMRISAQRQSKQTQLGLYRIADEGGFSISVVDNGTRTCVAATRSLS